MSRAIYHYAQCCKRLSYYLADGEEIGQRVTSCLECGAPMKAVVRHGIPMSVNQHRLRNTTTGVWGNFKREQQVNGRRRNPIVGHNSVRGQKGGHHGR